MKVSDVFISWVVEGIHSLYLPLQHYGIHRTVDRIVIPVR